MPRVTQSVVAPPPSSPGSVVIASLAIPEVGSSVSGPALVARSSSAAGAGAEVCSASSPEVVGLLVSVADSSPGEVCSVVDDSVEDSPVGSGLGAASPADGSSGLGSPGVGPGVGSGVGVCDGGSVGAGDGGGLLLGGGSGDGSLGVGSGLGVGSWVGGGSGLGRLGAVRGGAEVELSEKDSASKPPARAVLEVTALATDFVELPVMAEFPFR